MSLVEDAVKSTRFKMQSDVALLKERAKSWQVDKPKTIGFPTQLDRLDKLSGGLIPGEVVTVAGGTGSGKTSLAMQLAEGVAEHIRDTGLPHQVVIFSAEMTRFNLYLRSASRLARLDSTEVRTGNITAAELDRFYDALDKLLSLPMLVIDQQGLTSLDVRVTLKSMVDAGQPIGLAVVDYIQCLYDEGAEGHARISVIMRNLKAAMDESACCLMAISQYSRDDTREDGRRRPRLSDLKESGSIENASYQVWALHDPEPNAALANRSIQRRQLYVLKNRNGNVGKVELDFHSTFTSFHTAAA